MPIPELLAALAREISEGKMDISFTIQQQPAARHNEEVYAVRGTLTYYKNEEKGDETKGRAGV